jgi:hypothetical protein
MLLMLLLLLQPPRQMPPHSQQAWAEPVASLHMAAAAVSAYC